MKVPRYYMTREGIAEVNRIGFARTAELRRIRDLRQRLARYGEVSTQPWVIAAAEKLGWSREDIVRAFGVPLNKLITARQAAKRNGEKEFAEHLKRRINNLVSELGNSCKLTECKGQPRCMYCIAKDARA